MKVGVLLPTFQESADQALHVAAKAAEARLDGVFCYDHLWPMGEPDRPALAPFGVLAAVAVRHSELRVGTLVARVGLGSPERILEEFRTLNALSHGRVVAALGTGDRLSRAENEAYGLRFDEPDVRRSELTSLVSILRGEMEVWVGGGAEATNEVARRQGVALNLWNAPVDRVREEMVRGEVTWAGDLGPDVGEHLSQLEAAGITWAVGSTKVPLGEIGEWQRSR